MKRPGIILSIVFFMSLIGCGGCNRTSDVKDNEVSFDSIHHEETYHLFNDTTKPYCNIQINFIYPTDCVDKKLLKSIQSIFVSKYFGNSFAGKTPQEAVMAYRDQYVESYKQFEQKNEISGSAYDFGEEDSDSSFSYYEISKNQIYYNKGGILSFSVSFENFTGGAHGSDKMEAYVIDLNTGKLITENDIYIKDFQEKIAALIAHKIAERNKVSDPKELENYGYKDVEEIVPNGNFLVNNEGITYIYNEDEIAPYVMGKTKVLLSYDEIKLYMNNKGPLAKFAF